MLLVTNIKSLAKKFPDFFQAWRWQRRGCATPRGGIAQKLWENRPLTAKNR
jgi:hypothetical protein